MEDEEREQRWRQQTVCLFENRQSFCNTVLLVKGKKEKTEEEQEIKQCDTNVIVNEADLNDMFMDTYKNDKTLISPTQCQFDNKGNIKYMQKGDTHYYANTEEKLIRGYIAKYNKLHPKDKVVFKNQSSLAFGRMLFNKVYPKHIKSKMNTQVFKKFQTNGNLVQKYATNNKNKTIGIDINKCRTSCMRDNILGDYKRFNVMDSIQPYDKKGTNRQGFYYILTNNWLPCRGNGWYSNGFIEYISKRNNIDFKIKYQLLASYTYPSDYLNEFHNEVIQYKNFKFMSNGTIGSMAMTKKETCRAFFETNFETAVIHYFNLDKNTFGDEVMTYYEKSSKLKGCSRDVYIRPLDEEKSLFKIEERNTYRILDNDIPIYNQILEN